MGTIVGKKSRRVPGEAESTPEAVTPSPTSAASTASASSVGIPLPPRPPPPRFEEHSPTPLSPTLPPQPTDETESCQPSPLQSSASEDSSSDSERTASVCTGRELVERCLKALETGFGISFEREQLLDRAQEICYGPGETLIETRQAAVGVYIVKEGALEVLSPGGEVALCHLAAGEFCGELSSFFRIPCTATVRALPGHSTTVLLLPLLAMSQSSQVEQVPMHRLLQWCTKRSYVETGVMFDKSKASLLANAQILTCLKSHNSLFSSWSKEAINYIATKSSPLLFSSGDVIFEAGEEPSFLFLILRGSVAISGESTRRRYLNVQSSSEGRCIGQELLTGSRAAHTATAVSPVLAVPISLTDIAKQFPNDATILKDFQAGYL